MAELTYTYEQENGQKLVWKGKDVNELMGLVYQAATEKGGKAITPFEAIVITDRIDAMYGDANPDMFSWTQDIKK